MSRVAGLQLGWWGCGDSTSSTIEHDTVYFYLFLERIRSNASAACGVPMHRVMEALTALWHGPSGL